VRVWSGVGPITWNGYTWTGIGQLGSISAIDKGWTIKAKGITLTLSGIDPTLLGEFSLGQPVTVYLGLFNASSLIASPITSFATSRRSRSKVGPRSSRSTAKAGCST
jgi:hypothetical protein